MSMPDKVTIIEAGARDGLQNEPKAVSANVKIQLIQMLADAGLTVIEAGAFVSPKWIPQMADSAEVFDGIEKKPGVRYPVLTPNMRGLERAMDAGARDVAVFIAASETFSQKNTNCSIAESLERAEPVVEAATAKGLGVRGYVSTVLGCPFEGEIDPAVVADLCGKLMAMGCDEVSLGDTIGVGTPVKAAELVDRVVGQVPVEKVGIHFHDTYGQALANVLACLERGVRTVDAAVAGLGGCPYAPGATGNVATEDVLYMLDGLGIETGVDLDRLAAAGRFITDYLGRTPASRVANALASKMAA